MSISPLRGGNLVRASQSPHIVQFYEREEALYSMVSDFLADGLADGESAIVIATKAHQDGFTTSLRNKGIDPSELLLSERLVLLDARQTLSSFMDGAMPDPERFRDRIGPLIAEHGRRTNGVRAYGEMVDLLWRDGNPEGAVRLEELWNELATFHTFSLLCAYPIGNFYKESDVTRFDAICDRHTLVYPTEKALSLDGAAHARLISQLEQRTLALETELAHRRDLEAALRDALSARRNAQEELQRMYEMAQDANRAKDQFLATLSHELRTPLTAILGWSRMLTLGGLDDETTRTAVETIERSARAQASLIDDLLDLSRVVTGKLALQVELVDLPTLVHDAVQGIRIAADAKGITVDAAGIDDRAIINGDPNRLQQVVWNLLSNAIKYSDRGGTVKISVTRSGSVAQIVVADQGRGIHAALLPYIFEPFRQADRTVREQTGLGLGLAIVKHLTEAHGGTVHVTSEGEGKGATFTVSLPLIRRPAGMQSDPHSDEHIDLSGRTILIVEDDADSRHFLSLALQRCGATVCSVETTIEAWESIFAVTPDAIVTDLHLPGDDGFAFLQQLRASADYKDIPVVAVTALSQPGAARRVRRAGFDAYLRKPVDPMQFARLLATLPPALRK